MYLFKFFYILLISTIGLFSLYSKNFRITTLFVYSFIMILRSCLIVQHRFVIFKWIKSLSIYVPFILYIFNIIPTHYWVWILRFNILELLIPAYSNKLLCLFIILLAYYTPEISKDEKTSIMGFKNKYRNQLWHLFYTLIVALALLESGYFKKGKFFFGAIMSLLISSMVAIIKNNPLYWFPLRLYTLVFTSFMSTFFNEELKKLNIASGIKNMI
jgi:hypothetical protein